MSKSTPRVGWGLSLARLGVAILAAILPVYGLGLILGGLVLPWMFPWGGLTLIPIWGGMIAITMSLVGFLLLRLAVRLTSWLAEGPRTIRTTSHQGLARSARSDPLWDPMLDD